MNSIRDLLIEASEDLYWISEADYPFEVIVWNDDNLSEQNLLEKLGYPADFPVKTIDIDEFFKSAVQEQDWQDDIERAERIEPRMSSVWASFLSIDSLMTTEPSNTSATTKTFIRNAQCQLTFEVRYPPSNGPKAEAAPVVVEETPAVEEAPKKKSAKASKKTEK